MNSESNRERPRRDSNPCTADPGSTQLQAGKLDSPSDNARARGESQYHGVAPNTAACAGESGKDPGKVALPFELSDLEGAKELRDWKQPSVVYFLIRDNRVAYVGQSVCLPSRLLEHQRVWTFDRVLYVEVEKKQLDNVEHAFIWLLQPPLNKRHKTGWGQLPAWAEKTLARFGIHVDLPDDAGARGQMLSLFPALPLPAVQP